MGTLARPPAGNTHPPPLYPLSTRSPHTVPLPPPRGRRPGRPLPPRPGDCGGVRADAACTVSGGRAESTLKALDSALERLQAAAAEVEAARGLLARLVVVEREDGKDRGGGLPPWRLAMATAPVPVLVAGGVSLALAGAWVGGRRRRRGGLV